MTSPEETWRFRIALDATRTVSSVFNCLLVYREQWDDYFMPSKQVRDEEHDRWEIMIDLCLKSEPGQFLLFPNEGPAGIIFKDSDFNEVSPYNRRTNLFFKSAPKSPKSGSSTMRKIGIH